MIAIASVIFVSKPMRSDTTVNNIFTRVKYDSESRMGLPDFFYIQHERTAMEQI